MVNLFLKKRGEHVRKMAAVLAALLVGMPLAACTKKTAVTQPEPTVLTTPEVKAVETALSSADQQARDTVLVPELRGSNFPLDTKVVLDQATRKTGQHTATIEAEVAGHGRWVLGLVRQGEQWQVWHTQRATQGQSATPRALAHSAQDIRPKLVVNTQAGIEGCRSDFGKRVPVLFVHGFFGKTDQWTQGNPAMLDFVSKLSAVFTDTF